MSPDIAPVLAAWPFEPGQLQARLVAVAGRQVLQVRLDLGLLQMELDGRPDGARPHGAESLLDHLEARARAEPEPALALDPDQLGALMREGVQYYNRYMALFALGEYERVARDTARNLRLFGFVGAHAARDRDRQAFEIYRPFVTMMHARAVGEAALRDRRPRAALRAIDRAIEAITEFDREAGRGDDAASNPELHFLRSWRREVLRARPADAADRIEEQLELAVAREDYEEAARLRDQLRRLRPPPDAPGEPPIPAPTPPPPPPPPAPDELAGG